MTSPLILMSILNTFVLIGAACIALVVWYWDSVGRSVSDVTVKVAANLVKLIAGLTSVGGAYAAAHKEDWLFPAIAGLICVIVWDVLEKLIDSRVKAADKLEKQALARVEKECNTRTELLTSFRWFVAEKTRRLMNNLARRKHKVSTTLVRATLTPEAQLDAVLVSLATFFHNQLPTGAPETTNFRVGLYVLRDGVMQPLRAINLNNPGYDVFSAYRAHAASYQIDATDKPAHIVSCVNLHQTMIVEDCVAMAESGEFHFFNDNQRGYLRSMVAYYLDQVCCDDGTMAVASLAIDTDIAGFFREADRESLEFCLREFGAQLKLELLLHSMLLPHGGHK